MNIFQRIFDVIFFAIILIPAAATFVCPGCPCEGHTYKINCKFTLVIFTLSQSFNITKSI